MTRSKLSSAHERAKQAADRARAQRADQSEQVELLLQWAAQQPDLAIALTVIGANTILGG